MKEFECVKDADVGALGNTLEIPAHKVFAMQTDIKTLAAQLLHYFNVCYSGFEFTTFYSKPFIDASKMLIKDEPCFSEFLDAVRTVIRRVLRASNLHFSKRVHDVPYQVHQDKLHR